MGSFGAARREGEGSGPSHSAVHFSDLARKIPYTVNEALRNFEGRSNDMVSPRRLQRARIPRSHYGEFERQSGAAFSEGGDFPSLN